MSEIHHTQKQGRFGLLYVALGLALLSAILFVAIFRFPHISLEHGLMENIQALGLLATCGLFLHYSRTGIFRDAKPLAWSLSLFCLTFFLLEFDTRPFGIDALTAITNGAIRNTWLGVLWLGVGAYAIRHFKHIWPIFTNWLTSVPGLCMCAAGVFWITSRLIEDSGLSYAISPFFLEELMEVNAVMLMALSAYLSGRHHHTPI